MGEVIESGGIWWEETPEGGYAPVGGWATDEELAEAEASEDIAQAIQDIYEERQEDYVPPPPPPPPPPPAPPAIPPPTVIVPEPVIVVPPEEVSALSASIDFIGWIIDRFNTLSDIFYEVYLEALSWIYPFWLIADFFWNIASVCAGIAWSFYDFSLWIIEVHERVTRILSWSTIWNFILAYVPNLVEMRDWFYNWWGNTWNIFNDLWSTVWYDIISLFDQAKNYAASLVTGVNIWLANLQSAWDGFKGRIPTLDEVSYWWGNWTGNVLGVINTWWAGMLVQVQSLINSAFIERESFWAGWQDWRDKVTEFFSDPEDQVLKILERALERFW